jgi:hypothetical protein
MAKCLFSKKKKTLWTMRCFGWAIPGFGKENYFLSAYSEKEAILPTYNPADLPFWEQEKAAGPLTDVIKSRKRLAMTFRVKKLREQLKMGVMDEKADAANCNRQGVRVSRAKRKSLQARLDRLLSKLEREQP